MTSNMEAFSDEASSQEVDATSKEGITVAIRMRPLNKVEGSRQRIWKVLPKYNSITQTTNSGKPLSERVTGRTFFTFDKTFGEDVNTTQVYDSVAKGIVSSVVNGLNGTIFAYGQTSSGKTYTMQGSGSIEQGSSGEGGIVHMAAKDIFSSIMSQQNRVFLVRASFLEIYNEEVRDLLSNTNQTLPIREDPRRGVFVQSVEEIVTDFESLLRILFHGEKSRAIASTGMNERSSRSHTIFRVTIESREKEADESMNGGNEENRPPTTDGAVRVSTLNLVDLAGSESVRHTGATGERQKEGGMINQSLLTLSRVIVSLGNSNQGHINFRDSKLTRILQPSLSGNARMAVVCCATPSELYLEETRSTLQFASRAKLVKTNAQVNEVLDDRSTIRRLQRELAEARRQSSVSGNPEHLRNLESRAETAGTVAKEAKEKLDRLKASILNTGYLFSKEDRNVEIATESEAQKGVDETMKSRKRRQSDGGIFLSAKLPISPAPQKAPPTPKTSVKKRKKAKPSELSPNSELCILREALLSRNVLLRSFKLAMTEHSDLVRSKDLELAKVQSENRMLQEEATDTQKALASEQEQTIALQATFEETFAIHEAALAEKETMILNSVEKLEREMEENQELKAAFERVQDDLETLRAKAQTETREAESLNEDLRQQLEDLQVRAALLGEDRDLNASEVARSKTEKETLVKEREADKKRIADMERRVKEFEDERDEAIENYTELQARLEGSSHENADIKERNAALEGELATMRQTLARFEAAETAWNEKTAQSESKTKALQENVLAEKLRNDALLLEKDSFKFEIDQMKNLLTESAANFNSLQKTCGEHEADSRRLSEETKILEENCMVEKSKCNDLLRSNEDLKQEVQHLQASLCALSSECEESAKEKTLQQEMYLQLKDEFESAKHVCTGQEETIASLQSQLQTLTTTHESATAENNALKLEIDQHRSSLTELRTNFNCSQKICEEQESKYRVLQEEKKVHEEACLAEKLKSNDLLSSNAGLKQQLENLQASMSATTSEFESATKDKAHQHERYLQLQQEFERAKQACSNQEEIIVSLQSQLQATTTAQTTEKHNSDLALEEALATLCEEKKANETLVLQVEHSTSETQKAKEKLREIEEEAELLWKEKEGHETIIVELRTNLQTLESTVTELSARNEASTKQQADLEASTHELVQIREALEKEVKHLKEREDLLLSEGGNHEESIHILEAEIEAVKTQLVISTDRLGTLATEAEALRLENGDIDARLSAVEHQKAELENELTAATNQNAALKSEVSDIQLQYVELESNLRERMEENESLKAENHDMRSRMSTFEAERTEISNELGSARKELTSLRQQTSSLEETNHALESQIGLLEIDMKQSQQLLSEKETLIAEAKKFEEVSTGRMTELSQLHNALQSEKDALLLSYTELAAAKEGLSSRSQALQTEISLLQVECNDVATRLSDSEEARKTVETNLNQMRTENGNMETRYDSLVETASGMKTHIDDLEAQLAIAQEKVKDLMSERDVLLHDHAVAYDELQNNLETAENAVNGLKSEKANLALLLSTTEVKANELESQLETWSALKDRLNAENEDMRGRLCLTEEEKSELETQVEITQSELQSLKASIVKLEQTVVETEEQTVTLQEKLTEALKRSAEDTEERERIRSEAELLHHEASRERAQFVADNDTLQMKLDELHEAKVDWEDHKRELEKEIEDLRGECRDSRNQLEILQVDKIELESQLMSVKSDSMEARARRDSMEASRGEWDQKLDSYGDELEAAHAHIQLLTSEKDRLSEEWKRHRCAASDEISALAGRLEEMQENTSNLELQRNEVAGANQKLQADNDEMLRKLKSLQAEQKVEPSQKRQLLASDVDQQLRSPVGNDSTTEVDKQAATNTDAPDGERFVIQTPLRTIPASGGSVASHLTSDTFGSPTTAVSSRLSAKLSLELAIKEGIKVFVKSKYLPNSVKTAYTNGDFIFVCRCPWCLEEGKDGDFRRVYFVSFCHKNYRRAKPDKPYDPEQHLHMDSNGFVDYNASLPHKGPTARGKRDRVRKHIAGKNMETRPNDLFPLCCRSKLAKTNDLLSLFGKTIRISGAPPKIKNDDNPMLIGGNFIRVEMKTTMPTERAEFVLAAILGRN